MKRGVRYALTYKLMLFGCVLGVGIAVLGLSGCVLFNKTPIAGFTVAPSTVGVAPFSVTLSAAASHDPDGEEDIESYAWDFGDGKTGAGRIVPNTYTAAGDFTVILTVTDKAGAEDQARQTIQVAPPGPSARFTANPSSGRSPVTVTCNASASTSATGTTITAYEWTFGDGGTGIGQVASHTYLSTANQTFTITLLIRTSDGKTATATGTVAVTPPGSGGGTPAGSPPSAAFDVQSDSIGVAPLQVFFDPSKSEASVERTIILYTWLFGDTTATSTINASTQGHVFTTDTASEIFTVTLLVTDNAGASDSIQKTVKAYNHRPVAGFEIANPPGGDGDAFGTVFYANEGAAVGAGESIWQADSVVYGNLISGGQTLPLTVPVVIRSKKIVDTGGTGSANRWFGLDGSKSQHDLQTATGPAVTTTTPGAPSGYEDHNFSYDPEGQTWSGNTHPTWFPADVGQAWGIQYLYVNWGDGSARMRYDYVADAFGVNGMVLVHLYTVTADGTVRTITMTAVDYMGYESVAFSRTVTLKTGTEGGGDL